MSADPQPTPTPTPEQPPTVTFYQKNADDFMKALDQVKTIIARLQPLHPLEADFVRSHLNVPAQFVDTAISIVEQSPDLQALKKMDPVKARDVLQFNQAFRPAYDRVIAVADALKDTMDTGFAEAAAESLQFYAILKPMARDAGSAELVVHVNNLKRDLGRRGRPKKTEKAEPTPAPTTPGTAPQQDGKTTEGGKSA
jgi:hypothetical protein